MAEPRTKSGRVVKPSWRIRESESYSYSEVGPSPARSTSSLPVRSATPAEAQPPPPKRKRTSLGAKPTALSSSPFNSSAYLTPVASTSSITSVLSVEKRPSGALPPTFSSTPKPAAKPIDAAAPARVAPTRPSPPKPRPKATGNGSGGGRISSSGSGWQGPTIRSFVDFNDGSEELGVVLSTRDFWRDEDEDGAWKASKTIKPGPGLSYRISISVQQLPPGPGRPATKGIRRLSTASQPFRASTSSSSRRVPSPQDILASMSSNEKGKARAERPPTSSHGGDTDIGEGNTEDGIGSTDDEYDARIEQQPASSSSSSSSTAGDLSDEDFPSEEPDDDEDDFAPERSRRKRRKPVKAIARAQSPDFYGTATEASTPLVDDGRPKDRFGMPFPLELEDDDYDAVDGDSHRPFSGGLNLGRFENPPPDDDDQFMQEQYYQQPADELQVSTAVAVDPPVPEFDPAMMELLQHVVQNGAMAANALDALGNGAADLTAARSVAEVASYVADDNQPQDHEVLVAILAAERAETAERAVSAKQPPTVDIQGKGGPAVADPAPTAELSLEVPAAEPRPEESAPASDLAEPATEVLAPVDLPLDEAAVEGITAAVGDSSAVVSEKVLQEQTVAAG